MALEQQKSAPRVTRLDTYAEWQANEGIPIYDTFFVRDLKDLELGPWERTGGLGGKLTVRGRAAHDRRILGSSQP